MFDEAREHSKKEIELDPDSHFGYMNLATVEYQT